MLYSYFGEQFHGSVVSLRDSTSSHIALRSEPRLILARVAADDASRAAVNQAQAYFQNDPCWWLQQQTKLVAVYLNRCPHQQP